MHALDSADSSGGKYVAGPPKSIIGRHALNAHHHELKNVVTRSGQTLATSGANDESETSWEQIVQAIWERKADLSADVTLISCRMYEAAHMANASSAGSAAYARTNLRRKIWWKIPVFTLTINTGGTQLIIKKADTTAFANNLVQQSDPTGGTIGPDIPIFILVNGTIEVAALHIPNTAEGGGNVFTITRISGVAFSPGDIVYLGAGGQSIEFDFWNA